MQTRAGSPIGTLSSTVLLAIDPATLFVDVYRCQHTNSQLQGALRTPLQLPILLQR